jgi:CubicO group peptidase (beta-lactamase class C family)
VLAVLLLAVLAVYAWAWTSTDTSTIARALVWRESDVGDQQRFPARPIPAGPRTSPLPAGPELELGQAPVGTGSEGQAFDDFLREQDTLAFLVVHEDRLVFERYFDGATRASLQTSFSVAKSVLSTLVGIAIDEGLIDGVEDPVTRGFEPRRTATQAPIRLTTTSTSGGSTPSGPAASTPSGTTDSTSTSPPTPTPSSSASAATGESTTAPGFASSATSPTGSRIDDRRSIDVAPQLNS